MGEVKDTDGRPTKRGRGQPKKFQTAAELQKLIDAYFEHNKTEYRDVVNPKSGTTYPVKVPAYYTALLLYVGSSFGSIEPYEDGEYDTTDNKFSEVLARAKMMCETELFGGAAVGQYNERMTTGAMQRFHRWSEKTEIAQTNTNILLVAAPDNMQQVEQLMAGYKALQQAAEQVAPIVEAESVEVVDTSQK
jgi:hypothetical protein